MSGLACGATSCYIPEKGITLESLQRDIKHLCRRYANDRSRGIPNEGRIILRTEKASASTYSTDVIFNIFKAEGKGYFDSRTAVFGHLQQGGVPSPLDRIRATRLAVSCIDWLEERAKRNDSTSAEFVSQRIHTMGEDDACIIGIRGAEVVFSPIESLVREADMENRRGQDAWWMNLEKLIHIMAKYYTYEHEYGE